MTVLAPPRPPTHDDPRTAVERRREQEALIKEARRRTRRRRQRSAALVLLAVLLAGATGPSHSSGGNTWRGSSAAGPAGETKAAARNGKLAFADDLGQLQVIDPQGRADVIAHCPRSPRGCALANPTWSPDGRQIAYVSGSIGLTPVPRGHPVSSREHPRLSLYLRDQGSGRVRRLAGCGSCATQWQSAGLGWSPDGSSIAFSRDSGPRGTQSLWLVDTADGTLRRLTDCRPRMCVDVGPAWAPGEQLIVFSRLADDGHSALYTVRPDGTELTRLTTSPYAENPQWSPDGRQIAFDGANQIYIADADGSNQKLLFAGTVGNGPGVPSWSPDGTKLAFFNTPREPDGFTAEVWTMNPDGSAKERLYHSVCCVSNWAAPIWSPDGKKLAFATTSAVAVFVINPSGSGLRRISYASTSALSWQRLP